MKILLASLYPYLFMLLYVSIPFDNYVRALPNFLLITLISIFPFIIKKEDFNKLNKKFTLFFTFFILYIFFNSVFFGRLEGDFSVLKKMIIPLGLVILYLPIQDFKKLNKAIIFSSFAAIVYSCVQFVILVNQTETFNLLFFQETVDALLIERVYLGFLCILSILIAYQSLKPDFHPNNKYYLASILLTVLYLFIIMSKVAIVILVAILLLRQFYGEHKKLRLFISLGLLLLIGVFGFNSIEEQIKKVSSFKDSSAIPIAENSIPSTYRLLIWDCANKIRNSNSIFGMGFRTTNTQLLSCYETHIKDTNTKNLFLDKKYNTHNQYLDFYLSSGVLSMIFFIGLLMILFFRTRHYFFPTALLVSIVTFGMFENYFHRQMGAYYFGFILVMLLINNSFYKKVEP